MKHKMKMYEAAEDKYYKDLDICNVMDVIRSSMNFLSNFMTREQKLLLRFNAGNIIRIDTDSSEQCKSEESDEDVDQDDRLITNLQHKDALVSMFTIGKFVKLF